MVPRIIRFVSSLFSEQEEESVLSNLSNVSSTMASNSSNNVANTRGGRPTGTGNYTDEEITALLDVYQEFLPIGEDEFNRMHARFLDMGFNRTLDSMKRRCGKLHRQNIPTGDPTCPPDVKRAKRIKYMIQGRADIGDGEEQFDLENGFANNNNDGEHLVADQGFPPAC